MATESLDLRVLRWLLAGEVGVSSKTMAAYAVGLPVKGGCHPLDPGDLERCIKMVNFCDLTAEERSRVADHSERWVIVIREWDNLLTLIRPGTDEAYRTTYKRMKELGL